MINDHISFKKQGIVFIVRCRWWMANFIAQGKKLGLRSHMKIKTRIVMKSKKAKKLRWNCAIHNLTQISAFRYFSTVRGGHRVLETCSTED